MSQQPSAVVSLAPAVSFQQIRKRNGDVVPFNAGKIIDAIFNAARATGEFDRSEARRLTIRALSLAQAVVDPSQSRVIRFALFYNDER